MKRFDYLAPRSLAEALEMLSDRPEAIPLARGTDLPVQVKEGSRSVETLLSLERVPELRQYAYNHVCLSVPKKELVAIDIG